MFVNNYLKKKPWVSSIIISICVYVFVSNLFLIEADNSRRNKWIDDKFYAKRVYNYTDQKYENEYGKCPDFIEGRIPLHGKMMGILSSLFIGFIYFILRTKFTNQKNKPINKDETNEDNIKNTQDILKKPLITPVNDSITFQRDTPQNEDHRKNDNKLKTIKLLGIISIILIISLLIFFNIKMFKKDDDAERLKLTEDPKSINYGTFTDTRDGKTYKTVKIGNQIWMAENLNYDYFDGGGSWCYDKKSSNCDKYGRLYNWKSLKKIAPVDWHLPRKSEFKTLLNNLGGEGVNAYRQIIQGGSSGFNALFGGLRYDNGKFFYIGSQANFWSSSDEGTELNEAWYLQIDSNNQVAKMNSHDKDICMFSVRLIKD